MAAVEELKLYVVISREAWKIAKNVPGKMAAQCGHAFLDSFLDAAARFPERAKEYHQSAHHPKITLIADEAELLALYEAHKATHGVRLVKDAARTVFPEPMFTALGIGPILPSERCELLANLKPW